MSVNQDKPVKPVQVEEFSSTNYVDFLRVRKSDFVFDLLVGEFLRDSLTHRRGD